MSLPKNFNSTVNLRNRVESLNDLTFFKVRYDYKLTDNYTDNLIEDFDIDKEINGIKEFTALNEEQAKAKIKNWFKVLKEKKILKNYKIKSIKSRSFYDIVKENNIIAIQ